MCKGQPRLQSLNSFMVMKFLFFLFFQDKTPGKDCTIAYLSLVPSRDDE